MHMAPCTYKIFYLKRVERLKEAHAGGIFSSFVRLLKQGHLKDLQLSKSYEYHFLYGAAHMV